MKKKILLFILAALMIFSVCSCGDTKDASIIGKNSSNVYENKHFDLKFNAPEEWLMYTNDEIREVNDFDEEAIITDEDIEVGTTITDLVTYDFNGNDSVIIRYKKVSSEKEFAYDLSDDLLTKNEELLDYLSEEHTEVKVTTGKTSFMGEKYDSVNATAKFEGEPVAYSYIYYIDENYMVIIELCSDNSDTLSDIIDNFNTVK